MRDWRLHISFYKQIALGISLVWVDTFSISINIFNICIFIGLNKDDNGVFIFGKTLKEHK